MFSCVQIQHMSSFQIIMWHWIKYGSVTSLRNKIDDSFNKQQSINQMEPAFTTESKRPSLDWRKAVESHVKLRNSQIRWSQFMTPFEYHQQSIIYGGSMDAQFHCGMKKTIVLVKNNRNPSSKSLIHHKLPVKAMDLRLWAPFHTRIKIVIVRVNNNRLNLLQVFKSPLLLDRRTSSKASINSHVTQKGNRMAKRSSPEWSSTDDLPTKLLKLNISPERL